MSTILPNLQRFAGQPVGTPVYYSPEQCRRQPYNAKADVWSLGNLFKLINYFILGCVLYELCTYRYPYEGSTSQILIQKILNSK
jgi:serine/threonine protein kinase